MPPWRRTVGEVLGEDYAARLRKPVESYAARAKRFAAEEAAVRSNVDGWSRGLHSRFNKADDIGS